MKQSQRLLSILCENNCLAKSAQHSVHVGKGSQDDFNDAKIWLEPEIEVARPGRTLKRHALGQALKVILDTFALGKWTINKTMRNFFNTMYRACVYTVDC